MARESIQVWQQRIEDQQSSGLSCPVWCHSNKIAYSTFMKWRTKLQIKPKSNASPRKTKSKLTSPAFIEVPVKNDAVTQNSWDIELELSQNRVLRLKRI